MSRIKLQDENVDDPEIKAIFTEIKTKWGVIPPVFRAYGLCVSVLKGAWHRRNSIMYTGNVPFEVKEAIAIRVSVENKCNLGVSINKKFLEDAGVNPYDIQGMIQGEVMDEKLNFVLKFVSMATRDPSQITDEDFNKLREFGYSDEDIIEILSVMEMITGLNKLVIALGLRSED